MSQTQPLYTILPLTTVIKGKVVNGDKVGRTIGFPTANLNINPDELFLDKGVYLCEASFKFQGEKTSRYGLAYYGPRYIFGELLNSFEVYLYDFAGEIYGVTVTITTSHFMRPPLDLKSLTELQVQLAADKQEGLKLLESLRWAVNRNNQVA